MADYLLFFLFWINSLLTLVNYLMLNSFYTYPHHAWFLRDWFIGNFIFKQVTAHLFTQLYGVKFCYSTPIIQFDTNYLLAHS